MKLCTRCKLMKPLSEYHKHARSRDGHRSYCSECSEADKEKQNVIDKLVSVMPSHLPALTLSGVIWSPGFTNKHRSCDDCSLLETCGEAVDAGNYAGCESALESEIWLLGKDKEATAIDDGG